MPTYSYACTECGHHFDAVQSFTDAHLTECPVCSGRLRKLFNSVGIVFKGSGFYRTDSRAGAVSAREKADRGGDSATKSDGAKSDGAKTDGAKTDGAKTNGAKTNGAKSNGAKSNGAKTNGAKTDGARTSTSAKAPAKAR